MSPSRFLAFLASVCLLSAFSALGEVTTSAPTPTPHPPTDNDLSASPQTSTTPTPVPTTKKPTPTPTPSAKVSVNSEFPDNIATWELVNPSTNVTCIKFTGAVQIAFNYTDTTNKTNWVVTDIQENKKENYTISGSCGSDIQTLNVSWTSSFNKNFSNNVVFTFGKIDNKTVSLKELAATLIVNDTSVLKPYGLKFENFTELNALPLNTSFKCKSKLNFFGTTASSTLWFANLQYEAFKVSNSMENNVMTCSADSSSGGMSNGLMAFLIIVLIAATLGGVGVVFYFYKKMRGNNTNAYENM